MARRGEEGQGADALGLNRADREIGVCRDDGDGIVTGYPLCAPGAVMAGGNRLLMAVLGGDQDIDVWQAQLSGFSGSGSIGVQVECT